MNRLGQFYIISAPSGAGKTSLTRALVKRLPEIEISVSHTTRVPRPGEQEGVEYYFVSPDTFQSQIERRDFLEYAKVYGAYYGTSRQEVNRRIQAGVDVILEIDWQGAKQIVQQFPQAQSIFILPPALDVLRERLLQRSQDDLRVIEKRMLQVRSEISHYSEFDYLVVNDDFEQALADLEHIVCAQRLLCVDQKVKLMTLLEALLR